MTVDIDALLDLFSREKAVTPHGRPTSFRWFGGPCPYETHREGFAAEFTAVIDSMAADAVWGPIFHGDLSRHGDDHSRADLAFCGELARRGFAAPMIDMGVRASKLYRDKWERDDYRERTITTALADVRLRTNIGVPAIGDQGEYLTVENGRVRISNAPPPRRDWTLDGVLLAGKSAMLAGLGGVSKTQSAIELAVSVVFGGAFGGKQAKSGRVVMLFGEEDHAEINRRLSAVARYHRLSEADRNKLADNILAYPFLGRDMSLTRKTKVGLQATDLTERLIKLVQHAGNVRLIVLDHLALLHGGDFNAKEDATMTMREVNRIADETKASVLVLAHSPKSAAAAEESDALMIAGSAAFGEQTRAVIIAATMRTGEAKTFAVSEEQRGSYVSLKVVKNNYGPTGDTMWFKRVPFDEISVLEKADLVPPPPPLRGGERLKSGILQLVSEKPGQFSKTRLRELHGGTTKKLKASKGDVDTAIHELVDEGRLVNRPPTQAERKEHGLAGTVQYVLDIGGQK